MIKAKRLLKEALLLTKKIYATKKERNPPSRPLSPLLVNQNRSMSALRAATISSGTLLLSAQYSLQQQSLPGT